MSTAEADFSATLRAAARLHGPEQLTDADIDTAAHIGAYTAVATGHGAGALDATRRAAEAIALVAEYGLPDSARMAVDWSAFGTVVPVLALSPHAGASVLAAALTDAAQLTGLCTYLVDLADPNRCSGLSEATTAPTSAVRQVHQALSIRWGWRAQALVARLESDLPLLSPSLIPRPAHWVPAAGPLHVTIVDVGHDALPAVTDPLLGSAGWLRRGAQQRVVLAVEATRPAMRHAEQVLARLQPWVTGGSASAPAQLVVMGASSWPAALLDLARPRFRSLIDNAVFVPFDEQVNLHGVTGRRMPDPIVAAVAPLLHRWALHAAAATADTRAGRR
jgi:hypothetical protein